METSDISANVPTNRREAFSPRDSTVLSVLYKVKLSVYLHRSVSKSGICSDVVIDRSCEMKMIQFSEIGLFIGRLPNPVCHRLQISFLPKQEVFRQRHYKRPDVFYSINIKHSSHTLTSSLKIGEGQASLLIKYANLATLSDKSKMPSDFSNRPRYNLLTGSYAGHSYEQLGNVKLPDVLAIYPSHTKHDH
jgi:hypothetical protein